jgi:Poxvirus Late Transcription Factor VLTF3 like.
MSTFRYKPDKIKHLQTINTLDTTHRKFVSEFSNRRNKVKDLKQTLELCEEELKLLEEDNENRNNLTNIKNKSNLKSKIKQLKQEIYDIDNNVSELEYYCGTGDILLDYYTDDSNINNNELISENINEEKPNIGNIPEITSECSETEITNLDTKIENNKKPAKKMCKLEELNFLSQQKRKPKKNTRRRARKTDVVNTKSIFDFFVTNTNSSDNSEKDQIEQVVSNKATLYDNYMTIIDKTYVSKEKKQQLRICSKCNIEQTAMQSEGSYVCKNCGEAEQFLIENEAPNHKDAVIDKPRFPYKRCNHLNEWLNQFQAKESTEIPEEVYNNIKAELKKMKIVNVKKITIQRIRNILKKLKYNQYYEHTVFIVSRITNKSPPVLSRETEDKIKSMFKAIQEPFYKHCPSNRINFLSYSYVLHKIFQILGLREYVHYFDLLKSREKLRIQEEIWRKICQDLNWPFYPSISI